MSGRTPKLGFTVPDINDYIAAWPEIAEQGFLDIEDMLVIDVRAASALQDTYPVGMSMFGLTTSGAANNGWPEGSGMVITWRRTQSDLAFQLKVSQGIDRAPDVYARTGGSSYTWSPWAMAVSRDLPMAVATGAVTVDVASGATVATTVALPSGVFSKAPNVGLTVQTYYPDNFAVTLGSTLTAENFAIRTKNTGNGSAVSAIVRWQAIESGV